MGLFQEILVKADVKSVAVVIFVVLTLFIVTQWINFNLKIRSLGGRAYRIKTWLPGGTSHHTPCIAFTDVIRFGPRLERSARDYPSSES